MPNKMLHITDTLFIIPMKEISLEQIVSKKLSYYLTNQESPKDIFSYFYDPVEKSVIEASLDLFRGNQSRVAQCLEINRNTLKKKIDIYNIDIKKLFDQNFMSSGLKQDIYVSCLNHLDLLEISRLKVNLLKFKFLNFNPLKMICDPVEKTIIKTTLTFFKDNHLKTSLFLKISRNTLKKRLSDYRSLGTK